MIKFKFNTRTIQNQSKKIIKLLNSMGAAPLESQKLELKHELEKCRALNLFFPPQKLPAQAYAHLFEALKDNKSVSHLNLSRCVLSSENVSQLLETLEHNTTLSYLDLSFNQAALSVANQFIQKSKLRYLVLDGFWNSERKPSERNPFYDMLETLKTNTSLIGLSLNGLFLRAEQADSLIQALKLNKNLLELSLCNLHIYPGDISAQLEALIYANKKLVVLNLQNLHIRKDSIKALTIAINAKTEGPAPIPLIEGLDHEARGATYQHYDRVRQRAYATGKALNESPLSEGPANIIAGYLGYEGYEFTQGFKNKPSPLLQEKKEENLAHLFTLTCTIGLILIQVGWATSTLVLSGIGLSLVGLSLIPVAGLFLYTKYKNNKHGDNAKTKSNEAPISIPPKLMPSLNTTHSSVSTIDQSFAATPDAQQPSSTTPIKP